MKIIYMGTPDFAVGPLKALIGAGHDVVCVLTRADKPKGRGHAVQFSPVKEAALEAGIPVLQPVRMKDPELWKTLEDYGADLFVVAAYGRILPKEILSIPKYGCVNIHASLLPDYRGAAPIQWAVIDGRKESGVTTMLMNEGLDTGDILRQYRITLADNETGGSLFDKLAVAGGALCVKTLAQIADGTIESIPQDHEAATYTRMISKQDGEIDFTLPAERIECLIRGMNPWPSAYTRIGNKMLKIWEADVIAQKDAHQPGEIFDVTKDAFCVAAGEGALKILSLQLEGKKRMNTADFLRGYTLENGDCLG